MLMKLIPVVLIAFALPSIKIFHEFTTKHTGYDNLNCYMADKCDKNTEFLASPPTLTLEAQVLLYSVSLVC